GPQWLRMTMEPNQQTTTPSADTVNSSSVDALRDGGAPAWLVAALERLAKPEARGIDGYLVETGECVTLDQTQTCCRCHFVRLDANRQPRVHALVNALADQVIDYCIPRSSLIEAKEHFERTGSMEAVAALDRQARSLFVNVTTSGEGGELLLYLLLERVLGLPQLLCKMRLKTSTRMHVHGVDGVHGKILDDGRLALYWGESKLHARVSKAIAACFESVAPYLLDPGGGASERDLELVRQELDLGDPAVEQALLRYFDDSQPESARVEIRGACLIGFDLDDYPGTEHGEKLAEGIARRIAGWQQSIAGQVTACKLERFELEVFCVPLPSVEDFRARLSTKMGLR
ncbi:MAG: HamA C-terminal domain-containing protein, partial [Gaiellaceae bacterium]